MSSVARPARRTSNALPLSNRQIKINVSALTFWAMFVLCHLFLSRLLIVATLGKYRLGVAVVALGMLSLFFCRSLVKNVALIATTGALCAVIFLSARVNNVSLGQFVPFVRIPVVAYLVYHLVWHFLNNQARVEKVLRYLYIIAVFQLPLIALQRLTYPWLPERLKFGSVTGHISVGDFGIGSFTGDSAMSFCLVGLLILLLFERRVQVMVRRKWLMAMWLTLTVLFANSQIQHVTVVLVWAAYFLSHLRLKTILTVVVSILVLAVFLIAISQSTILFQSGVMTFTPLQATQAKFSRIFSIFERDVNVESFFSLDQHTRDAALYYYLHEPVRWLGIGPGVNYDTVARERRVSDWGHVFTFYAEVGLIGLLLSMCFFFVLAFPVRIERSTIKVRMSWVQLLMFMAISILCFAKYPMNDSAMMFTYCITLVGHHVLTGSQLKNFPKPKAAPVTHSV